MKRSFAQAWQDYRLLICIGILYAIFCTWQAFMMGISAKGFLAWLSLSPKGVIFITVFFIVMVIAGAYVREVWRADFRFPKAWGEFRLWLKGYLESPAFAGGVVGVAATYFALFFIIQKSMVRWVFPYAWDVEFARWDKALHFGRHPYEYLLDWFGGGNWDWVMQFAYLGWFVFMYIGLGYALFCERDRVRKLRFVWVFTLAWMLMGGFGALVLSSVGPVYYHHFCPGEPDIYKRMTDYFAAHKDDMVGILHVQKMLLKWNYNFGVIIPNGISAMPSMHAAISTLVALYTFGTNRVVFGSSLAFSVLIVVSSIYFGFHYAIDSYASIICISFMWWASGKLLERKAGAAA